MDFIALLGPLFGGLFRLAPEVIKFFDRKDERKHELALTQQQIELAKIQGNFKMQEIAGQTDIAHINALMEVAKAQAQPTGIKWVDAWNALMRPIITTQWVVILYPAVMIATYVLAVDSGVPALQALVKVFGTEEKAICGGILTFWFLDRMVFRSK